MQLRGQIAALRGALSSNLMRSILARMDMPFTGNILAYRLDMSHILRAVRLALWPARSHIQHLLAQ